MAAADAPRSFRQRRCWWCNHVIARPNQATESWDYDGNVVIVHQVCALDMSREMRPVTAQPRQKS